MGVSDAVQTAPHEQAQVKNVGAPVGISEMTKEDKQARRRERKRTFKKKHKAEKMTTAAKVCMVPPLLTHVRGQLYAQKYQC
jgi:U3 small nucleolar ribonucleoprotein component